MTTRCILGAQWGDEGKGKIIDLLAAQADVVVRFAGGNNAGHTVVTGGQKYAVHLLPSGVFRRSTENLIGGGVVIDPWHLLEEIEAVRAKGVDVVLGENLLISEAAHLVLPYHRSQDHVCERLRGEGKIGTTGRGIGPAYQDRASRQGLRFGDLQHPEYLRSRLASIVAEKNRFLASVDEDCVDADQLFHELIEVARPLLPAACDTGARIHAAIREGKEILFEGAQGLMLDVDHGTFPYVTSTTVGIGGVGLAGISPRLVDEVILVAKAYTTRVGEGPFPTELDDAIGEQIRQQGNEFGTTTGRPRRCGYFDAVAARYAVRISGADCFHVTNLDVLSGIPKLRIATAYEVDGQRSSEFPIALPSLRKVVPIYEDLETWTEDLSQCRSMDELPRAACRYVDVLEERIGVPIRLLSIGPDREQVITRESVLASQS